MNKVGGVLETQLPTEAAESTSKHSESVAHRNRLMGYAYRSHGLSEGRRPLI